MNQDDLMVDPVSVRESLALLAGNLQPSLNFNFRESERARNPIDGSEALALQMTLKINVTGVVNQNRTH